MIFRRIFEIEQALMQEEAALRKKKEALESIKALLAKTDLKSETILIDKKMKQVFEELKENELSQEEMKVLLQINSKF